MCGQTRTRKRKKGVDWMPQKRALFMGQISHSSGGVRKKASLHVPIPLHTKSTKLALFLQICAQIKGWNGRFP